MKLLIAPIHYIIDPDEGSEYTRAYEYVKYLTLDKEYSGDILVAYSKFDKIGNFRIHRLFDKKPVYISNLIRFKFIIWIFLKSLKLIRKNKYNCIWHYGPFAIGKTFSLLALMNNKKIPFIIGPIFTPLVASKNDAFGLFGKKSLEKNTKLPYIYKIDAFLYGKFSNLF